MRALARLRARRDVRLVMIGQMGENADGYRVLADELGVADSVAWTGWLPSASVGDLLAAVDLCVLPYRRNSLGRSALAAALEAGAPTVLGGAPGDVGPLRAGTHVELVPPADPVSLAATIERLLDDPAARQQLAAGARRGARVFAWPRIAQAALSLYREALTPRR
jgi:glycosyltransferase involved in cell wall biosynthesis